MSPRSLCFALLASMMATGAHGHATSTNFLILDAEGDSGVEAVWDIAVADLHWALGLDADADGRITWGEITAQEAAISAIAAQALTVSRGGKRCTVNARDMMLRERAGEAHISLGLAARCPAAGQVELTSSFLFALDASQRTLLEVSTRAERFTSVLSPDEPRWIEPETRSQVSVFATFLGQGAWHVWVGYDHIAFLVLLLLPSVLHGTRSGWHAALSRRAVVRDIVAIVTAFTVAHSITLVLAATGAVLLPARPIEIAIAASIIAAGLLNLSPGAARWRLPLAFAFGLVHGFGFANALAELGSSGARMLPLLAGFNIGVELGQLAIVAVVLPALLWLRTSRLYATRLMPTASVLTMILGGLWLAERLMT